MATRFGQVRWPTGNLPEVMGGGTATLHALIREYLFISLFRACAESLASENASRLAAMERADKNINDLLEQLQRIRVHAYNLMGPMKGALENCVRYLAAALGPKRTAGAY
jgi:enoyl-[acyl-carrier-protein] reductase (NADH)